MRAGPYMRARFQFERSAAAFYLAQAAELETKAAEYRKAATESEQRAQWWASDTDIAVGETLSMKED